MIQLPDLSREYISTAQAAEQTKLSKNYFTHLLRNKLLEGFKLGRDWFIYKDSLERFLEKPRKPGPSGPRKRPTEKPTSTSASG